VRREEGEQRRREGNKEGRREEETYLRSQKEL